MIVSSVTSKSSLITESCFGMPFEILVSLKSRLHKMYRSQEIVKNNANPPPTTDASDNFY